MDEGSFGGVIATAKRSLFSVGPRGRCSLLETTIWVLGATSIVLQRTKSRLREGPDWLE
jgi:hypothetical protein